MTTTIQTPARVPQERSRHDLSFQVIVATALSFYVFAEVAASRGEVSVPLFVLALVSPTLWIVFGSRGATALARQIPLLNVVARAAASVAVSFMLLRSLFVVLLVAPNPAVMITVPLLAGVLVWRHEAAKV